jgi:hypothetical protein
MYPGEVASIATRAPSRTSACVLESRCDSLTFELSRASNFSKNASSAIASLVSVVSCGSTGDRIRPGDARGHVIRQG